MSGTYTTIRLSGEKARLIKATGIALILSGLIAAVIPHAVFIKTETAMAVLLFAVVIIFLIHAYYVYKWRDIALERLRMIFFFFTGILLLINPFCGVFVLSVLLASFFIIHGITKLLMAFTWKHLPAGKWMLMDSLVSILFSLVMFQTLSTHPLKIIGLLMGMDLIYNGLKLLVEEVPL
jgi:uncharacterized membrane protein HdeD (DUF308 family)